MDKFFDLGNLFQQSSTYTEDKIKRDRFIDMHCHRLDSIKNLVGKLPDPGEALFIETLKSFNAFTFIVYMIKEGGPVDDLFIATYSINTRIVNSLVKWMDKQQIRNVEIYISDSIKHRMPRVVELIENYASKRNNLIITYAWTHKKVICAKIADQYYIVEGSGNFSENSAQEQYLFTNSKQLYDFRKGNN